MFNRFFPRNSLPPLVEDIDSTVQLKDRPHGHTAREALAAIRPSVEKIDGDFRLVSVSSGTDIGLDGRALTWEFTVYFPRREAEGMWTVRPCTPEDYENPGKWCAIVSVRSIYRGINSLDPKLQKNRGAIAYLRRTARESAERRKALPLDFVDSPQAVMALAAQGADWISGDSHMTLASQVRPDGAAVWHTTCWDREFETPVAERR